MEGRVALEFLYSTILATISGGARSQDGMRIQSCFQRWEQGSIVLLCCCGFLAWYQQFSPGTCKGKNPLALLGTLGADLFMGVFGQ